MSKDWSLDLEHDDFEQDRELIIKEAINGVGITEPGYYVNLVTANNFGNPKAYLIEPLEQHFGNTISYKYIDQCGCGGYVLRVWRK